ncbi:phage tail tape measure protein [Escherichia coli]|nr:phage tail tape measure protein [Escherichia coli]AUL89726.1 phage tail tape measure protein [Escherichia coli]AUM22963.1 phage tail tape measure protein [Escherichia coli]EED1690456.1 phage tail tape measure protein [Escherichia coli]EET9123030.1 phage tail tape measure protein [Escherichia coli]
MAGLKSGWSEWEESATDCMLQVKSAATQTFDGIAQNMAAMLTGSEQNWRSFTGSVLSMMTEILLKQAMVGIVGSIGSAIGGAVGGGASASGGMAYSRVSTFSGDYLRVTDNKGKTHDVLTGSDDGRHSNTSLAWGAGVQFNPTESVAIDIAYEGSGSGDWRTDGFIVGVGYKF